eukprot:5979847-Pyramimonas_sp.AAC.1
MGPEPAFSDLRSAVGARVLHLGADGPVESLPLQALAYDVKSLGWRGERNVADDSTRRANTGGVHKLPASSLARVKHVRKGGSG